MDGKLVTAIVGLAAPAVLIGVTIAYFGSNPLVIAGLLILTVGAAFYLLSYTEAFPSD